LIEPAYRNEFLETVKDPQVLYYWRKAFPQLTGNKSIGPVLTRLGSFLDRKPIRYMVTQKENRLDFAEIMNRGKIFLAKLSQGQIGNENAYLLGGFMVSKFQQLAMARQAQVQVLRRAEVRWLICVRGWSRSIYPLWNRRSNPAMHFMESCNPLRLSCRRLQSLCQTSNGVMSQSATIGP
jgi:hypothetical protein